MKRANAFIPKTHRSRVVRELLARYLAAAERTRLEREYASYYARQTAREAREEQGLLHERAVIDQEAWAILGEDFTSMRPSKPPVLTASRYMVTSLGQATPK